MATFDNPYIYRGATPGEYNSATGAKKPTLDTKTGIPGQDTATGAAVPGTKSTADINTLFNNAYNWEPKYQHKFIMTIGGIPTFLIKSSAKPQAENGEIILDHINVQRKVKGKTKWNSLEITLYDAITPSGAQVVMEWFRAHHESATGRDGYSSFYKKDLTLEQLDGMGNTIEEWTIKGAFIQSCNWGALDWSVEDVQVITATLTYDYAFMHF